MLSPTRYPGLFRKKEGGFVVRGRVKDPLTGKPKEILKAVACSTEIEALQLLESAKQEVRTGSRSNPRTLFSDFAVLVLERKLLRKEIKSRAGHDKWKHTLTHFIAGTIKGDLHVPGFGDFFVDAIQPFHVEKWKDRMAGLIAMQAYSPTTLNGWLSNLRVVAKAAAREFRIANFTDGVDDLPEGEHSTYSPEEPNSLSPKDVPRFLEELRIRYPQFYAMAVLGFVTGLRPSTLRPLRRRGQTPDVLWAEERIWIRQSQTRGADVMKSEKTGKRCTVDLPGEVMAILKWHVDTQLRTPEQQDSDLLFPSVTGGFRAPAVLNEPFAEVAKAIGVKYQFTQLGMRRTFQDLARAAEVQDLVTRSISGHSTARMQEYYSTVQGHEQRESLARVIQLVTPSGGSTGGMKSASGGME